MGHVLDLQVQYSIHSQAVKRKCVTRLGVGFCHHLTRISSLL